MRFDPSNHLHFISLSLLISSSLSLIKYSAALLYSCSPALLVNSSTLALSHSRILALVLFVVLLDQSLLRCRYILELNWCLVHDKVLFVIDYAINTEHSGVERGNSNNGSNSPLRVVLSNQFIFEIKNGVDSSKFYCCICEIRRQSYS